MKSHTIRAAALLIAAIMLCSVFAACSKTDPQQDAQREAQAPDTAQPTAELTAEPTVEPTPEPTVPPNVLYGGMKQILSDDPPSPGRVSILGNFRDEYLDQAERDGSFFAVKIVVNHINVDEELQQRINSIFGGESNPLLERDRAYGLWYQQRTSDPAENQKFMAFYEYEYAEEALKDVLFEDYWRKNAPAEELAAYDAARELHSELLDEALGDAVREELARLQALGLNLKYEYGGYMSGYLTADQIRSFPAGDEHGFIIYWQLDPELTPERVEEMLNGEW